MERGRAKVHDLRQLNKRSFSSFLMEILGLGVLLKFVWGASLVMWSNVWSKGLQDDSDTSGADISNIFCQTCQILSVFCIVELSRTWGPFEKWNVIFRRSNFSFYSTHLGPQVSDHLQSLDFASALYFFQWSRKGWQSKLSYLYAATFLCMLIRDFRCMMYVKASDSAL